MRINYWNCPVENAGNGISKTLKINKNFLGEHAPRPR